MNWIISLTLLLGASEAPPAWPGFLGAGATAIDPQSLPLRWSPTAGIAWTRELPGYGQSSPVIWGDRVYVTTIEGDQKERLHVICCSLASGEVLWDHVTASTNPEQASVYISRAAPTPVVDARAVYAYFEGGDVVAISPDGELLWQRSLAHDYGKPQNKFGLSSSPVQTAERLFVLVDDEGPAYLVAIEKGTGEVAWKMDRSSRKSWVSPMLVTVAGEQQLVVSSDGSIDGYRPADGQLLWSYKEVGGNTGTTPLPAGEGRFLVSASAGRDGENAELAKSSNGLFQIERQGEQYAGKFAWTNPAVSPSWGSPIVHEGFAYWVNRSGVVWCLNLQDGSTTYTERTQQGVWATPVAAGERIYLFGKDGLTTVLKAGPEFAVLAENLLWNPASPPVNRAPTAEEQTEERRRAQTMFSRPTLYGAAVVNGHIVLRTGSQLFCIAQPTPR